MPPPSTICSVASQGFSAISRAYKSITTGEKFFAAQKTAQLVVKEGIALSRGAESINAGINLNRKLSRLESFQQSAARTKILPDGRIRYYDIETMSQTTGPTRGACNVLEWNPKTGSTRGWYECHNYSGNVNRVHPKNINGQVVFSPHYPPTGAELLR